MGNINLSQAVHIPEKDNEILEFLWKRNELAFDYPDDRKTLRLFKNLTPRDQDIIDHYYSDWKKSGEICVRWENGCFTMEITYEEIQGNFPIYFRVSQEELEKFFSLNPVILPQI